MEFEFNGGTYRVERGLGTGKWLILNNVDDGPRGWRLIGDLPSYIEDYDVVDAAKASILGVKPVE